MYLIPSRMVILKRQMISVGKDVNEVEPLYTAGGDVNGATTLENSLAVLQMVTQNITIYPCHSTPRYIQNVKISSYKKLIHKCL